MNGYAKPPCPVVRANVDSQFARERDARDRKEITLTAIARLKDVEDGSFIPNAILKAEDENIKAVVAQRESAISAGATSEDAHAKFPSPPRLTGANAAKEFLRTHIVHGVEVMQGIADGVDKKYKDYILSELMPLAEEADKKRMPDNGVRNAIPVGTANMLPSQYQGHDI
jgi:hypothetical protein